MFPWYYMDSVSSEQVQIFNPVPVATKNGYLLLLLKLLRILRKREWNVKYENNIERT